MKDDNQSMLSASETSICMGKIFNDLNITISTNDQDLIKLQHQLCKDNPQFEPNSVLNMLKAKRQAIRTNFLLGDDTGTLAALLRLQKYRKKYAQNFQDKIQLL